MDALSQILHTMRLESSLISQARLSAPWGIWTPAREGAIYHAVVEGECWFERDGDDAPPLELNTGDVIMILAGDAHHLISAPGEPATPIYALPPSCLPNMLETGGGGALTRLLCGSFHLDHAAGSSLYALLPEVLHIPARDNDAVRRLAALFTLIEIEMTDQNPGYDAVITRLLDVVLIQLLRVWVEQMPDSTTGWLAATRDAQIGKALALIHDDPACRITVPELAAQVGMSRSSFFARFSERVGEPPARYLTRWRMHSAADLITRRSDLSIAELAERVGYLSEDSFSKAFKRHMGHSPAAYRRHIAQRAAPQALSGSA